MEKILAQYREEVTRELHQILSFWINHTIDANHGGFVGRIDHQNHVDALAPKGSVLNSRILWSFSAACRLTGKKEYLSIADRAFDYFLENFIDKEYGGVYWTVDYTGKPLDTKKQIYALSFAVYGLSEYFRVAENEEAKQAAITIYNDIVKYSYDKNYGGYIEALSREWKEVADLRLSAKDANEKKSMNTHLHLLEGFASLYRVWPDAVLKRRVIELITAFTDRIISKQNNHLALFFDEQLNEKPGVISYGHDIEAAWLVQEAAELMGNELLILNVKNNSLLLAEAASKGLDKDGGLWYEYNPEQHHLVMEKHWWPQAEAMVGYLNAWQIAGEEKYLERSLKSWQFIKDFIIDKNGGEWHWGVKEDYSPMKEQDKVGMWKCPYHNPRACIEVINRTTKILNAGV